VHNVLSEFTDLNQESPTLDLTSDCFRFVTGFFEVISTSAPHIYHSALLLSPQTSIIWELYGLQAHPLARVVRGTPTSWDPSIAQTRFPSEIKAAVWSPCSRFIAITGESSGEIAILDAATLEQLYTMHPLEQFITWEKLIFSPNGHVLTGYSWFSDCITSWDLQTGGLIGNISIRGQCNSMLYSGCGTMLGVLFGSDIITTYNIVSGIHIFSHSIPESVVDTIWTHGECLQFATVESGSIIIWEVSFTSSHAPIEISSLPTPDNFSLEKLVFLPTLFQLAFIFQGRVLVWDAQHQKTLLDSDNIKDPTQMSFSPNGCFFICVTGGSEFHLWKKSPDGYFPHQKFVSNTGNVKPVISPDGEAIISFGGEMLQLWHTTSSTTSSPSISAQVPQNARGAIMEFSPNESLVAVAQWLGNTATVLSIRSGNPLVVIDTSTRICGMRITESTIIIVSDGKIVTWDLPAGDGILNVRRNIDDCLQTTILVHSQTIENLFASISPDLNYIAFGSLRRTVEHLWLYDMYTGKQLAVAGSRGYLPGFTLGGHEVWCTDGRVIYWWAIVKEDGSNVTKLEHLEKNEKPPGGFSWESPHGFQVTDDGWILNSNGKQLLWLPHHWRSIEIERGWGGKSLVIWSHTSPEAVILEFEV